MACANVFGLFDRPYLRCHNGLDCTRFKHMGATTDAPLDYCMTLRSIVVNEESDVRPEMVNDSSV